ncbi:alkaline phosphatase family protein [Actinobaculum sp. 313]|uniref:alkaline phosphatase family protein n=1 Tax=Actinobaculum sp. 313 TaxID=2495645 RepID=UPI001F0CAF4B|nr:alkaline phosphatase family protein [Actinobaculum sp. 313]
MNNNAAAGLEGAGLTPPISRNVRATLSAALDAVGLATSSAGTTSAADRALLGLPKAERVCFVLVDGLGAHNLAARSGHVPTLRAWTQTEPLTTVAPSTTAAAITAVGTGEAPGATAMMSYALRSPASGRSFSLISWNDPGLDPVSWQRMPTLFEQLGSTADACRLIQPASFVNSGLTLCALRGAKALVADSIDERIDAAAAALRTQCRAVYLYWEELDHAGHRHGWTSEQWTIQLEALDSAMAALARRLPSGTLIVLTADHGMVDVAERMDVADYPELQRDVDLVSGEERLLHLYTREPGAVAARWREALGQRSMVLLRDDAIATGIFGEVHAEARAVMGDVLVIQHGDFSIMDSRGRDPHRSLMRGVHGSLTAEEMLVPLITEVV